MIGAYPMMSDHRRRAALVLVLGVAGTWQTTLAAEFECRHGDLMRRVEVNTGDAVQDAACEVRYWRNASAAGDGEVLWRANQDLDFCDAKARDLLGRLERGGWTCTASDPPGEFEAVPEAARPAAGSKPPPALALTGDAPRPAPEPGEPEPGTTARAESSAPIEQPTSSAAARVEPAAPTEQPAPGATAGLEPAAPAEESAAPPAENLHATILDQIVQQTLRSVQQMYGGDFHAEDAAFGDLDGDGRDDAAVLVTYQTDRKDYVQYLVAYLFDGETFQSTATKNVGGRFLDAVRADVRGIVDRAIVVDLEALDEAEVCCETRRAEFVLKEGQLVEVEDRAEAPRGRT
jgi:hypothetical protein